MMAQASLFDPIARRSDPNTSHLAARKVKRGNEELIKAIVFVARQFGPLTAYDFARLVDRAYPGRWSEASIRTALPRAGLVRREKEGRSPRGQLCAKYELPALVENVNVTGGRL